MLTQTIIENILILIGESFWVFSVYSQLHRLLKTKNKKGLSAVNFTFNAAADVAWITYFASIQRWLPLVSNVLIFVMSIMVLALLLTSRRQFYKGLAAILILGPLTSVILTAYPQYSGFVGVALNTLATAPWIYHVVSTKKTSGISQSAIFFSLGAMASTMAYGILINSWPLIVGVSVGFFLDGIIIYYYYRYRHF